MDTAFQGKNEKGEYEQFEWNVDRDGEPTEDNTGLTDIEPIDENSRI